MNNNYERQYKELCKNIIVCGSEEPVRDNNIAKSLFGQSLEFNNQLGLFPMLTSKKMFFKNIKHELAWMLNGLTNVKYLNDNGVSIWNKWADENGDIGDSYGRQLRSFNGVDQFTTILKELSEFKYSRQLVISLWNPVAISQGNRKPCYHSFQFVYTSSKLNIIVSQRSADVFVGLPYDMAFFSLLLVLVCKNLNLYPGVVKINIGNAHIYKEHYDCVMTYLNRDMYDLPTIENFQNKVIGFETSLVKLYNYKSEDFINAKIIY